MNRDFAETVALQALDWLLGQDELRGVFLGATGASPAQFAGSGPPPELLLAVLDFLCMDDGWIVAFCDTAGLGYDVPNSARAALPGGEQLHWT